MAKIQLPTDSYTRWAVGYVEPQLKSVNIVATILYKVSI